VAFSFLEVTTMLIGYARVSTSEQETHLQMDALRAAGVQQVFAEKGSSVGPRPELRRALAGMAQGDVLVVWKLDRLSRGLVDLLDLIDQLKASGCGFKSLTEPIDTTNPLGVFMLQVLGAVAQLERSLIHQRVLAGQVAFLPCRSESESPVEVGCNETIIRTRTPPFP
jgi:DNA invertase Pin-like site-specific DNA recombinase